MKTPPSASCLLSLFSLTVGDAPESNAYGSIDVYFSHKKPERVAADQNWVKPLPDQGFFVYMRYYGPLKEFNEQLFAQSCKPWSHPSPETPRNSSFPMKSVYSDQTWRRDLAIDKPNKYCHTDLINVIMVSMKTGDYVPQRQLARLTQLAEPGKVVILYGPRRVGKTTLVRHYAAGCAGDVLLVTGEDIAVREYLESQSVAKLTAFAAGRQVLIIDEAQAIREVGLNLKLLVDHVPDLTLIATGSSSFALAGQTGEPLTGRVYALRLFPLAQQELAGVEAPHETRANLDARLVYGSYPEVVLSRSNQQRELYLKELVSSYLFKDILQYDGIRRSDKLLRLLQLLAFQIGQDVSVSELGTQLSMSKNTVDRYLDLLEQVFVIYSRCGFSRNLRKEITKSRRYYFVDNGVRNTVISNFNPPALRDDMGALWENYAMTERMKRNLYDGRTVQSRFWRTYDQQEIDLIEEAGGELRAYEMKRRPRTQNPPRAWAKTYPSAPYAVVHPDNYLDFIV